MDKDDTDDSGEGRLEAERCGRSDMAPERVEREDVALTGEEMGVREEEARGGVGTMMVGCGAVMNGSGVGEAITEGDATRTKRLG